METPCGTTRRRGARSARHERRAARRAQVRAWQRNIARSLEAEWFLANEEQPLFDELLATGAGDAASLYVSASMRGVLGAILPAINREAGIFLVTGDAGIGKSAFAAHLGVELQAAGHLVVSSSCSEKALDRLFEMLTAQPLHANALMDAGRAIPVLLADTAELLSAQAMSEFPTRCETKDGRAGIRLVLIGRPALAKRFEDPTLADLKQLVRFHGWLGPLTDNDILLFVGQLTPSDHDSDPVPSDVLAAMVRYSERRPANVRFLWTQARRLANSDGEGAPRLRHIEQAAQMMLRPRVGDGAASGTRVASSHDNDKADRHPRFARFSGRRVAVYAATAATFTFLWFVTAVLDIHTNGRNGRSPLIEQAQNTPQIALDRPLGAETAGTPTPSQAGAEIPGTIGQPADQAAPSSDVAFSAPPITPTYPSDAAQDVGISTMTSAPIEASGSPPLTMASNDDTPGESALERPALLPLLPSTAERGAPSRGRSAVDNGPTKNISNAHHNSPATPRGEPGNARLDVARLNTSPQQQHVPPMADARVPLVPDAPAPTSQPAADGALVTRVVATVAAAEPQCQPYVSNVDYAGSNVSVRGLACRDATGHLWLMDQRSE